MRISKRRIIGTLETYSRNNPVAVITLNRLKQPDILVRNFSHIKNSDDPQLHRHGALIKGNVIYINEKLITTDYGHSSLCVHEINHLLNRKLRNGINGINGINSTTYEFLAHVAQYLYLKRKTMLTRADLHHIKKELSNRYKDDLKAYNEEIIDETVYWRGIIF